MLSEIYVYFSSSSKSRQGLLHGVKGSAFTGVEDNGTSEKLVVSVPTSKDKTIGWVPKIKIKVYILTQTIMKM